VIGIGADPEGALSPAVRDALSAYLRVPQLFHEEPAAAELAPVLARLGVDRIESNWEPCVLLAARLRDMLGVPGMSRDTVLGFRDKQLMKERLRAAGVRVPHSRRVTSMEQALEAAEAIGFPVIVKPIAGAGSADTFRCDSLIDLEDALERTRHVVEMSLEEFIEGEEFTYDTIAIDGLPVFENVAQYFPRPLIARSEQWISPAQIVYRDPYLPKLLPGIELGRQALTALGMGTGFTHMEWYRKPDGEVVFGEIACRNGGGHFVDMMNWSNDCDLFVEWGRAVSWHAFEAPLQRAYHVGMVFKRAQGEGRIARILGMEEARRLCGRWLIADELLPIGSPRRNWKQTLLSDGFLAVRHPELDAVHQMMDVLISQVTLFAS
jgi:hypothetical protein